MLGRSDYGAMGRGSDDTFFSVWTFSDVLHDLTALVDTVLTIISIKSPEHNEGRQYVTAFC